MDVHTIDANDPCVQLKITSALCSFFALGATIYRLYKRRSKLWADDVWALFACVALIIQVVAVFMHFPLPKHLSKRTRIALSYLMGTAFYSVVWASRLSILFSIVRIDPSVERRRRLFWVAAAFVATALLLLGQLLWVCETNPSWKKTRNPQCELPLQVAICQIVADVISDLILLFAPLPLFRNLLDKSLGHKLTLIFSTCVVTTIVSLFHATFILLDYEIKITIAAMVEGCLSLIVANIPVIITTTIDIVGDQEDQVRTVQFSTIFWSSEAQTTGTMQLHTIGEERPDAVKLSYAKTTEDTPSCNQIDLPMSQRTVVDRLSPTKPVVVSGDPILPV
ncbi:hypothetical protein MVEN_00621100 [Mycena venus]|uniref:Rhodopsin domain-containing protein n=1 Tax=Mycena venus TaxID=2733690 RepID=A0A8H6YK66_9AGAR|nr:hypothetical protein MVEN_00621100 [Mycena venus]